jgi:hypothetical protein
MSRRSVIRHRLRSNRQKAIEAAVRNPERRKVLQGPLENTTPNRELRPTIYGQMRMSPHSRTRRRHRRYR